ncbi:MAG: DUF1003 domain-containing protein [Candidatus Eisenbacteria bacterium]|uniref:DUF1003 domain-containing protein n=1 Tax=Eiseniibacteriota bacterium TaxID=2212470 RepID=A0A956LYV6_UNCEI|nr:DUF1003 domain-containing protein [Candidatus Eisenbacteria bacterium]
MSEPVRDSETCQVCGRRVPQVEMLAGAALRTPVATLVRRDHPEFDPKASICQPCNARYRAEYVQSMLEDERGDLSKLEREVIEALRNQELVAANLNEDFGEKLTPGQRIADRVATFGGSWAFIILFGVVILAWMSLNAGLLLSKPFDPYPFILLNLVLSTLAALQAPVIMMSQNRQAAKDRLRSEHDYRVNLKAELEIRLLHSKLDELLTHQWQRLLEIQQVQMDVLEELGRYRSGPPPPE